MVPSTNPRWWSMEEDEAGEAKGWLAGWLIGDWERRRSSRHPMAGQAQTTNPMSFFRPPSLPVCLSDCITKTPHNAPLPRDLGSSTSQPLLLRTSGEWVEMVVYSTR
jgi:hypothetical protein